MALMDKQKKRIKADEDARALSRKITDAKIEADSKLPPPQPTPEALRKSMGIKEPPKARAMEAKPERGHGYETRAAGRKADKDD